jgi:hypothetical protein
MKKENVGFITKVLKNEKITIAFRLARVRSYTYYEGSSGPM